MANIDNVIKRLTVRIQSDSEEWDTVELPIGEAEEILALLKEQPQWINVKDRLPKSKPDDLEYPVVIIALSDGSVELGCYYESTHEWGAGEYFDRPRNPVAWMPLPEPPEGVKQND